MTGMPRLLGALLASIVATAALGQSRPGAAMDEATRPMVVREAASDRVVVTRHRAVVNGRKMSYRAIVAETTLTGRDGKPAAVAVIYAYLADRPAGARPRPVLFAFNGGPGASSSLLHLHGIGPRHRAGDRIVEIVLRSRGCWPGVSGRGFALNRADRLRPVAEASAWG